MIYRQNWLDTKEYEEYLLKVGRDVETVSRVRSCLRHLLEWADDQPFGRAREIDPAFPTYLLTSRMTVGRPLKGSGLSAATMKKICDYARLFFEFARDTRPASYKKISKSWIETVRPGMAKGLHSEYHEHEFYTLEQIRKIAGLPVGNLREERDRAAAVFMFLSAMRGQAFVSMPIKAFNLERLSVSQFPELGVRTKNHKAARTSMLRIPDLVMVVQAWHEKLLAAGMSGEDYWFAVVDRWHRKLEPGQKVNFISRRDGLAKGMRELCKRAGIPYLSPHKLRHGHTVYVMRRVRDMKGLKSLSQNLMHSSVAITDGIYGRLVSNDIEEMYEDLGE